MSETSGVFPELYLGMSNKNKMKNGRAVQVRSRRVVSRNGHGELISNRAE
jgi:hypothetical protein